MAAGLVSEKIYSLIGATVTSGPFSGKRCAVTGAGGSFGRALLLQFHRQGGQLVALRHGNQPLQLTDEDGEAIPVQTIGWQVGEEEKLEPLFRELEILVINHGINKLGARDRAAAVESLEVNTISALRLLELFMQSTPKQKNCREVWVNTSEAEVNPALSPLYEISKRALGQLLSLRSLDAPCTVRKLILGPFKSALNPYGFMQAPAVAAAVMNQALKGRKLIIVSPNPITWILMPLTEWGRNLYYRRFTQAPDQ
jgi:short-subunit dehydrogenase